MSETLVEVLKDAVRARAVVNDGVKMIDDEVHARGGLSGMALKAAYKAVCMIKPGIIEEALGMLLPEFAPAIDPFYARGRESGDVKAHFTTNADAMADALLAVTDGRRQRSKNKVIQKSYDALRPQARKLTAEAMPRLAGLVSRHVR